MSRRAKWWCITLAVVTGVPLLVSMFATEITRAFVHQNARYPFPLPRPVDIRVHDGIVRVIGRGAEGGRASAVTLGYVIVVPQYFNTMAPAAQRRIITHELKHVAQRRRYGRFYLPIYGLLYLIHGYSDHPFERGP